MAHVFATFFKLVLAVAIYFCHFALAGISTSTSVPPLQWLNVTRLLSGPSPPPLKGASMGYDDTTRSLLIFGGESAGGFPQSNTYILNLDSLIWTIPMPPTGLGGAPQSRSDAISGSDMAASDRHGHVVIGGKGSGGVALSDVWEYDYISQFWTNVAVSPGSPTARWGASGGIDPRVSFIPLAGLNNSFYLIGGTDGTNSYPLSDLWRLNISGALSSNLPHSVYASWELLPTTATLPAMTDQAGAIIFDQLVAAGGCTTVSVSGTSCATDNSYVVNAMSGNTIAPAPCPAPRIKPVLAPNLNGQSSNFASQVFMLLGTYNTSLWQDGNGLERGEVAVLDIGAGTWSRILPAGDPLSTSPYPSPRTDAVALSFSNALIGTNRAIASDTIVFGGQDINGIYLSEIWILRAYNGSVSFSNTNWAGYGDGTLSSGANANGSGVNVTFLTTCAQPINRPSSSSPMSSPTGSPQSSFITDIYDTQLMHKLLAPLSIAMILPAILLYRTSSPRIVTSGPSGLNRGLANASILATIVAYGFGIGGFATSFTSITYRSMLKGGSSASPYLKTPHGQAGIALFVVFYALIPFFVLLSFLLQQHRRGSSLRSQDIAADASDIDEREKMRRSPAPSALISSMPETPISNVRSSSRVALWPGFFSRDSRRSNESESFSSTGARRSFEVTNRPVRVRRTSENSMNLLAGDVTGSHRSNPSRNLGDINWLERRRSLNAVNELDFALGQLNRRRLEPATSTVAQVSSTVMGTADIQVYPEFPSAYDSWLHVFFHAALLGLCILTLIELWNRAPVATFAVFLVWSLAFYISMFILAWNGRPQKSVLAVVFYRLRFQPQKPSTPSPSPPLSTVGQDLPISPEPRGPYLHHQPLFRTAPTNGNDDDGIRVVDTEDEDDDEDEEVQQRRIEDEMNRREVSIVTVPRRKLWITNPS